MHTTGEEPEVEFWCRGCRHVGSRPLTEEEEKWIRRLRSAHAPRIALGLAVLPLAILVPLAVMSALRVAPASGLTASVALWSFAALVLGLPVAILLVRDHWRIWSDLRDDLAGAEVWSFEPPSTASAADEARGQDAGLPRAFALLPSSRRVVDAGVVDAGIAREDILEVDPHTGIEFYAPLSLQVTTSVADVQFEQRPLSPLERRELNRVRSQLFRPRVSTAFAVLVFIGLFALIRLALDGYGVDRPQRWGDIVSTLLAMAICVRTLVRYTRSVLLAGKLGRDLATGLVVKVEGAEVPNAEMLPFSRLFWRVAGAPAGWRDRHRAAETLRASL
jgi:hypothetical protein